MRFPVKPQETISNLFENKEISQNKTGTDNNNGESNRTTDSTGDPGIYYQISVQFKVVHLFRSIFQDDRINVRLYAIGNFRVSQVQVTQDAVFSHCRQD
jgi:hypothetical protein